MLKKWFATSVVVLVAGTANADLSGTYKTFFMDRPGHPHRFSDAKAKLTLEGTVLELLSNNRAIVTANIPDPNDDSKWVPVKYSGTWKVAGEKLRLTTTATNGEQLKKPRVQEYTLAHDRQSFRTSGSPYVEFRRIRRR